MTATATAVLETPTATAPLLEARHLIKNFAGFRAVNDVSLAVHPGETFGIVGESGCGKSTTARMLLRLLAPDAGSVHFDGEDLAPLSGRRLKELRRRLQVVPQNPQTSLNPRLSIGESIAFNLRAHGYSGPNRNRRIPGLLDRVGLDPSYATRYPHQLSGGQLQRAAIARALATEPELVICDEAVSALDKSVQAQVLNLLAELQADLGIAYLFISHDLAVVEHICDRVAVMYQGRVVEYGPAAEIWRDPQHAYTATLLASTPGRGRQQRVTATQVDHARHDEAHLEGVELDGAGLDSAGLDRAGRDRAGLGRAGLDRAGLGRAGLDQAGLDRAGAA